MVASLIMLTYYHHHELLYHLNAIESKVFDSGKSIKHPKNMLQFATSSGLKDTAHTQNVIFDQICPTCIHTYILEYTKSALEDNGLKCCTGACTLAQSRLRVFWCPPLLTQASCKITVYILCIHYGLMYRCILYMFDAYCASIHIQ